MTAQQLEQETRSALVWEWRTALFTILGGFVIAIAVTAYIHFHTPSPQAIEATNRAQAVAATQTARMVCVQALAAAKNFGIVPNYASLATALPSATQIRGRYLCSGATGVARYTMAVDLFCRELKNPRCVNLFSVTQQDGTILYKRQS